MTPRLSLYALAMCAPVLAGAPLCAAAADPPPPVQPLRDVDVTYKVPVPGTADTMLLQRLRWSVGLRKQRVDLPTSGNWMVLDFNAGRMMLVRDDVRQAADIPAPAGAGLAAPGASDGFTRLGTDTVAGLACTQWQTGEHGGEATIACYTQDGVLLRARNGARVVLEATVVHYATQEAAIFNVPAGYTSTRQN